MYSYSIFLFIINFYFIFSRLRYLKTKFRKSFIVKQTNGHAVTTRDQPSITSSVNRVASLEVGQPVGMFTGNKDVPAPNQEIFVEEKRDAAKDGLEK